MIERNIEQERESVCVCVCEREGEGGRERKRDVPSFGFKHLCANNQ